MEHPAIANCLDNFGMILVDNGKFDEAEPLLLEALAQGRKFYGDRSPHEDHVLARLAIIAARRGDEESQLQFLRDGVAVACRVYSEGHRYRKEAYSHLIKALQGQIERHARSTDPADQAKARARFAELDELARTQDDVKVDAKVLSALRAKVGN